MDFKQNTQAAVVTCPCLVPQTVSFLSSFCNFLALSDCFSGTCFPVLTANSACLDELGNLALDMRRMTMKPNVRERDEKIIAVHSILPGDVRPVTMKMWGRGEG